MSILNVDVNFSSSGGSHSASITEIVDKDICKKTENNAKVIVSSSPSLFGSPISTTNSKINQIIKDFVIEEITTTVSEASKKRSYKLIDKASVILDSSIVLVRGLTASPINDPLSYEGVFYDSSELPASALSEYDDYNGAGSNTTSGIFTSGNISVIGGSYSTIEFQDGGVKFYAIYQKGSLKDSFVAINGQTYSANMPTIDAITKGNVEKSGSKFGYTAKELINCIKNKGFSFVGVPSSFSESLVLFETSGSMRECLSAITSFFGFYWFVDGMKITFVNSLSASQYSIPDPTNVTDSRILEASFTEGGRTPSIIASFVGKENGDRKSNDSGEYEGNTILKRFNRVNLSSLIGDSSAFALYLAPFYNFLLYGPSNSSDIFDKIFLYGLQKYPALQSSSITTKFYTGVPANQGEEKSFSDLLGESEKEYYQNQYAKNKITLSSAKFFNLMDSNGKQLENPSGTSLFKILEVFFKYFNGVFISKGFSENATKTLQFASSELNISEAIQGSSKISEVEALKDLHELLVMVGAPNPNPTVKQLSENAAGTNGSQVESDFYFISTKSKEKQIGEEVDEKEFNFLTEECILGFTTGRKDSWLALTQENGTKITNLLNKSKSKFLSESKREQTVKVTATRIKEAVEGSNDDLNYRPLSYVFYKAKESFSNNLKSQLRIYDGSFFDAKKLSTYFANNPDASIQLNSSSVTYYDLEIPSKDITLDGISIQFSSDGVTTTITRSNKVFLASDQSLILTSKQAILSKNTSGALKASSKNFFGLH
jgi:hypothetical protein